MFLVQDGICKEGSRQKSCWNPEAGGVAQVVATVVGSPLHNGRVYNLKFVQKGSFEIFPRSSQIFYLLLTGVDMVVD